MRSAEEPAGLVTARLARGDELFGWISDETIVSFGWVAYRDRCVGPVSLKDSPGRVFLYNFFTVTSHRGRGLYPALLLAMRSTLGREGASEFLIDVNVRNTASARGIAKAGFVSIGRIGFFTFLDRWRLPVERTVRSPVVEHLFRSR